MVRIDGHDVVEKSDRPVRTEHAVLAVVYRRIAPQALEIRPETVGAPKLDIADIDVFERHGHRIGISTDTGGKISHCKSPSTGMVLEGRPYRH